jgi:hypothetical protein
MAAAPPSPDRPSSPPLPAPTRNGQYSPPPLDWRWQPRLYVGDAARAGANAFIEVFEEEGDPATTISVQMCFVHVQTIWCNRADNKALLHDVDTYLPKIKSDLTALNYSVFEAAMVPVALSLMYAKWRDKYGEARFAAQFERVWAGHRFTRAEANEGFYGGLPSDNNGLEAKNRTVKAELLRERPGVTALVPRIAEWLAMQVPNRSCHDLFFVLAWIEPCSPWIRLQRARAVCRPITITAMHWSTT